MWKLVIEDDEGKRTVVPLTRDDYTIGRKEGNTIRLTERNVSREHVKLRKKNGAEQPHETYVLEDLTSYNGVYVNGLRVASEQDLVSGDLIQIGDYRIVCQDDTVVEQPPVAEAVASNVDAKATIPSGAAIRGALLMERPNRLVMLVGPTPGVEFPLDRDRLTIGRAEDATISVNHNSVSRLHCEVHALGEGRFEIVDKGSSNGVRVNAADLRRGIIEAGDLIELGDVRFKFVGAGQVFVPSANESQQLSAISDREVDLAVGAHKKGGMGIVGWALAGTVIALGLVGTFWYLSNRRVDPVVVPPTASTSTPPITSAAPSAADYEQTLLADAKKGCTKDDCEQSHLKLATGLAERSPLRESADFKAIEGTWADSVIAKADAEPDAAAQRAMFQRVAETLSLDPARRKTAADKLQALEEAGTAAAQLLASKDAGPVAALATSGRKPPDPIPTATTHPTATHPTSTAATTATGVPTATSTTRPPARSDFERAQAAATAGDAAGVKSILEIKVYSGRGSPEEIRLLRASCRTLHDTVCTDTIKQKYP